MYPEMAVGQAIGNVARLSKFSAAESAEVGWLSQWTAVWIERSFLRYFSWF